MKRVIIELEYRGTVPVKDAMGAQIDCLRGRIWITEHGCAGDVVLDAGQSYQVSSRDGSIVVQALREAIVAFRAPVVRQARAGLGTWIERLSSPSATRAAAGHPAIAQQQSD